MRGLLLSVGVLVAIVLVAAPMLEQTLDTSQPEQEMTPKPSAYAPRQVALKADALGHFNVRVTISGRDVDMLADTGASVIALTEGDARRIGLNPGRLDYSVALNTANGRAMFAPVMLDRVSVDGIRIRDVQAVVAQRDTLHKSLLGMSFIGRIGRFDMKGDELILVE